MKKILVLAIVTLLLWSCVTIKLRRNLTPPLKDWFDAHESIMNDKIPKWLDERGGIERAHFLRLPIKMQILYTHFFWKMRLEGAKEIYYSRMAWANRYYDGWKKDMGYVFLLCGNPVDVRYFNSVSKNEDSDIQGYKYQAWYYPVNGMYIGIVFKYSMQKWELFFNSTMSLSNYHLLIENNKKLFHPTEEGYELWGNKLLEWVKEQEKR